jgi:hypothetical protein
MKERAVVSWSGGKIAHSLSMIFEGNSGLATAFGLITLKYCELKPAGTK